MKWGGMLTAGREKAAVGGVVYHQVLIKSQEERSCQDKAGFSTRLFPIWAEVSGFFVTNVSRAAWGKEGT